VGGRGQRLRERAEVKGEGRGGRWVGGRNLGRNLGGGV